MSFLDVETDEKKMRGKINKSLTYSKNLSYGNGNRKRQKFNENQSFSVKTRKDTFHNKLTSLTKEGVHNPHPETEIRKFHESQSFCENTQGYIL